MNRPMNFRPVRIARAAALTLALVAVATAAAAQTSLTREQVGRRYNVRVFENVLVSAAQHGAELLGLRVQQIDPSIILLTGTAPRAQGFVIDGHGLFFHVEIPTVDPVVAWAVRTRGRDAAADTAIASIRRYLQSVSDPAERADLEAQLRRLEQRVTPPGQATTVGMQTAGSAPAAPAVPQSMEDPDLEYERLVTQQLVDAMLDHSHQLGLGADEWLTVAARGTHGPLMAQAAFDDSVTLMLRIKGSDLAAFRAGSLTRDEARARVVVREF